MSNCNVNIVLSAIQLVLAEGRTLPLMLSVAESDFVIPKVDFNPLYNHTLESTRDGLLTKYVDVDPSWVNFTLLDAIFIQGHSAYKNGEPPLYVFDDEINIVYGCMIPFGTPTKNAYWQKTSIASDDQFKYATKTLQAFSNI